MSKDPVLASRTFAPGEFHGEDGDKWPPEG